MRVRVVVLDVLSFIYLVVCFWKRKAFFLLLLYIYLGHHLVNWADVECLLSLCLIVGFWRRRNILLRYFWAEICQVYLFIALEVDKNISVIEPKTVVIVSDLNFEMLCQKLIKICRINSILEAIAFLSIDEYGSDEDDKNFIHNGIFSQHLRNITDSLSQFIQKLLNDSFYFEIWKTEIVRTWFIWHY